MTLAQLLSEPLPALDSLRTLWLVFSAEMEDALESAQEGNTKHRVSPVILADGRLALCADLLSETHEGGLFAAPFARLNPANFSLVEVIDDAAFQALQPQPQPEEP
jgi:hypothetical protein